MKIVHLNKSDIQGGAARAAYRLHTGLRQIGVDSQMLVDSKVSDDPAVYGPEEKIGKALSMIRPFINEIPLKFYDWQGTPFYTGWKGRNIATHEFLKQSDIVHLHWIAGGFLSVKGISKLAKLNKPIVWTLHDMWAFTGGCHYSGECEKYIDSCGACPQLNSNRGNDITKKVWTRKRRAYKNLNLTIATPSSWLAECAKRSSLFSSFNIEVIPNGLDTTIFKPVHKLAARNILNLPKDKKIILFGAFGELEERKGFSYFKEAISKLEKMINRDELCLVVFGASPYKGIEGFPFEAKILGRLYDDFTMALAYSAADVFVISSIQDNLPNTVMETLSCGTPVVGFNTGGIPDMIDHKENGYLAEYKNSQSLAEGIRWVLKDSERALKLAEAARKKALQEYSLGIQAERYKSLYSSLLERKGEVEYHGSKK